MTLTNQIADLESQHVTDQAEVGRLREQVARQQGALLESRAQNDALIRRNEKLAAQCARYDKHFRDALGSGEQITKYRDELAPELPAVLEPKRPPPDPDPSPVTLKSKLKRHLTRTSGEVTA